MKTFAQVLVIFIIHCHTLPVSAADKNATSFVIQEELSAYVINCASHQLIGLSAVNGKSLLFYDMKNPQSAAATVNLPLPGELLQVSGNGKYIAVTHDSYISTVSTEEPHHISTKPIDVVKASSVAIVSHLICLVPAFDQWTNIKCLNVNTGTTCTSANQVYAGGLAFTDVPKDWVYQIDTELSPQSMYKYTVSSKTGCLENVEEQDSDNDYDYGLHLWFSYDGGRIFLQSGLTLITSDNKSDMTARGDFNSSYETYQYNYFSQSPADPYTIAGVRSDTNQTVNYYTWPYLVPYRSQQVPALPKGKITGIEEVHYCDHTQLQVIVRVVFPDGSTKIGVE